MAKRIPLTRGKFALVSDEDYDRLNQYKWNIGSSGYACTSPRKNDPEKRRFMHQFVISVPDGYDTDHINRNKLDNRRENLRAASRAQNVANTGPRSGKKYKGVYWSSRDKLWYANIFIDGRREFLGCFKHAIQAAMAYDRAASSTWGDFAYLNFPHLINLGVSHD